MLQPIDPRFPMPPWAVSQCRRASGLIEDTCEHGVGHPNKAWLAAFPTQKWLAVHGCDGCCLRKEPAKST